MIYPEFDDPDLAYETGLHIGDGNLTRYPPHYRYVLSGNRKTEYEFYQGTVVPLLEELYQVKPSLYTEHNSVYATTYSKPLVLFKTEQIGLPVGPKDQLLHLPRSIMSRSRLSVAQLLSGLFDTDGSPKVRRTPSGNYPRLSFAQKVKGIVEDVRYILLSQFGISSTLYRNDCIDKRSTVVETRWFLDINGFDNLMKFIDQIGSRHPGVRSKLRSLSLLQLQ